MTHKANHEIIYKDEFNTTARIAPGRVLTDAEEKALAKDMPNLLKSKAIVNVEQAEEKKAEAKKAKAAKSAAVADKK